MRNRERPNSLLILRAGNAFSSNHAYLEPNRGRLSIELYCRGFFEASISLLDASANNSVPVDTVFYPAVYLFRHGLELALKTFHALADKRAGDSRGPLHGHRLQELWQEVRSDLEFYLLPPEPELESDWTELRLEDVDAVVEELESFDATGEAFRYDRSTKGEIHLPTVNSVDLPQLRDVVRFVSNGMLVFIDRAREVANFEQTKRTSSESE